MKKKEKEFNPSHEDIRDAYFIFTSILKLRKNKFETFENNLDVLKDLEIGIRSIASKPDFELSAGFNIIDRFYTSWQDKSLMAQDIKLRIEKNEMDHFSAIAIAVLQTFMATMPEDDKEQKKFIRERTREFDDTIEKYEEWKKIMEKQEDN